MSADGWGSGDVLTATANARVTFRTDESSVSDRRLNAPSHTWNAFLGESTQESNMQRIRIQRPKHRRKNVRPDVATADPRDPDVVHAKARRQSARPLRAHTGHGEHADGSGRLANH
jgi:hypothetical protein